MCDNHRSGHFLDISSMSQSRTKVDCVLVTAEAVCSQQCVKLFQPDHGICVVSIVYNQAGGDRPCKAYFPPICYGLACWALIVDEGMTDGVRRTLRPHLQALTVSSSVSRYSCLINTMHDISVADWFFKVCPIFYVKDPCNNPLR